MCFLLFSLLPFQRASSGKSPKETTILFTVSPCPGKFSGKKHQSRLSGDSKGNRIRHIPKREGRESLKKKQYLSLPYFTLICKSF